PARAAPPRSVHLPHMPQPAGQENRAARALPPWTARRPGHGASGPCPLRPVPPRPVPSPAGESPTPARAQTPARLRVPWLSARALGLPVLLDGVDGVKQQSTWRKSGYGGAPAPGRGLAPHGSAAGPDPDTQVTIAARHQEIGSSPQGPGRSEGAGN